ncbi:hypothetical protein CCACVL1_01637, partial [Corchorus capsularis]
CGVGDPNSSQIEASRRDRQP